MEIEVGRVAGPDDAIIPVRMEEVLHGLQS